MFRFLHKLFYINSGLKLLSGVLTKELAVGCEDKIFLSNLIVSFHLMFC